MGQLLGAGVVVDRAISIYIVLSELKCVIMGDKDPISFAFPCVEEVEVNFCWIWFSNSNLLLGIAVLVTSISAQWKNSSEMNFQYWGVIAGILVLVLMHAKLPIV